MLHDDDALIFSFKNKIKCCILLSKQVIALISDKSISLFDLGKAQILVQCCFNEEVMPITMWAIVQNNIIVVQGKLGYNYVFLYQLQELLIKQVKKYQTFAYGFCKMMRLYTNRLISVSEELKALIVYDMETGKEENKAVVGQQKYCESVTCITVAESSDSKDEYLFDKLTIFLAQQGNYIHKIQINNEGDDKIAQVVESLQIKTNQEIKAIQSLEFSSSLLYCLIRKHPYLYIIATVPKLSINSSIDFKFGIPRQLKITNSESSNRLILADKNKIIKLNIQQKNYKILVEIQQSSLIQSIECSKFGFCGCTEEKQFFHLEI